MAEFMLPSKYFQNLRYFHNLQSERVRCKKILVNLKETAKTMKEEYEKKEETKIQLKKSYEKLKGGNKRYKQLL